MTTAQLNDWISKYMAQPPRMIKAMGADGVIREVDADKLVTIADDRLLDVLNDARLRAMMVFPLDQDKVAASGKT